jgi:hypothetical protein
MQIRYSRKVSTKDHQTDTIDSRFWEAIEAEVPNFKTEEELIAYCRKEGRKMKVAVAVLMDETMPKKEIKDDTGRDRSDRTRRD